MGQYLQDGQRCMMETFLSVEQPDIDVKVVPDEAVQDGFDYLNGMGFAAINRAAQEATISAHCEGGVPCMVLRHNPPSRELLLCDGTVLRCSQVGSWLPRCQGRTTTR